MAAAQTSVVDLANYRRARSERVADTPMTYAAPTGFALVWLPVWYPAVAMQPYLAPRVGDDRPAG